MAEYCKNCIRKYLGIDKTNQNYKGWIVKKGYLCEGCGYKYLKDSKC